MQAEDIESYLAELGMELQNLGAEHPIRVLLVGGAYMLTQMHNRVSTNDVDVLLKDLENLLPHQHIKYSKWQHA